MHKFGLEKSEMSTVEFCQKALRHQIAPPHMGSVKARIRYAAMRLGWSYTRTKDAWYAHPGIRIDGYELKRVEIVSGLEYGRQEIRSIEEYIAKADALLEGQDADFYRPMVDAFRSFIRALDRT